MAPPQRQNAFPRNMVSAFRRTQWAINGIGNLQEIFAVDMLAFSVMVVISLYCRLLTMIHSVVYVIISLMSIGVEYLFYVVETIPYILGFVLGRFQMVMFYAGEHLFYFNIFIISVTIAIYKDVLLKFLGIRRDPANSDSLCTVCLNDQKEVARHPCGHAQFCESCALRLLSSSEKCPACRGDIGNIIKIFQRTQWTGHIIEMLAYSVMVVISLYCRLLTMIHLVVYMIISLMSIGVEYVFHVVETIPYILEFVLGGFQMVIFYAGEHFYFTILIISVTIAIYKDVLLIFFGIRSDPANSKGGLCTICFGVNQRTRGSHVNMRNCVNFEHAAQY